MTGGSRARRPAAPSGLDTAALFAGIHWHQRWQIFDEIYLPGRNDVQTILDYVGLADDLTGKRVLDVGAWNGGFSFECERRGATEVVALSLEDPASSGFNRLQSILGSKVFVRVGFRLQPGSQRIGAVRHRSLSRCALSPSLSAAGGRQAESGYERRATDRDTRHRSMLHPSWQDICRRMLARPGVPITRRRTVVAVLQGERTGRGPEQLVRAKCCGSAAGLWFCGLRG